MLMKSEKYTGSTSSVYILHARHEATKGPKLPQVKATGQVGGSSELGFTL